MGYVCGSVSMGIYCRPPGCSPELEDEAKYPLSASAEAAGMQACRNCRPYRLPQAPPLGTPELICRAVRLIVAGVLDEHSEAGLAARLGVSSRHLRRLFIAHLGVTPDGVARSCRAHFARRLLDDTDLPITQIAYAAGFGSTRQFNRDCQRIFRATPSQIRAKRSSPVRLVADGGLTLRLWFTNRPDWDAHTSFLAVRAVPGVEHVDARTYRRTITVDGGPGVLELGSGGRDHMMLRAHLPHWAGLIHVAAQARRIARLDEDTAEPARWLAGDPAAGSPPAAGPATRLPGAWDPFEIGVAAILGQWLDGEAWRSVMTQMVRRLGREVPGLAEFGLSHTFPTPGRLTHARTDLQAIGLTSDQAETIRAYAAAAEQGTLGFDGSMTSDQVTASITMIPGIAASTARYIALRTGEPTAFLATDLTPGATSAFDHAGG